MAGDIVVGEDDGVVTFPQAVATALLERVRFQQNSEADIIRSIRGGRYTGAYGKPRRTDVWIVQRVSHIFVEP